MKKFNSIIWASILVIILVIAGINLYLSFSGAKAEREYIVEISRISKTAKPEKYDIKNCKYVKSVRLCEGESDCNAPSKLDYTIRMINGKIYRFEYIEEVDENLLIINGCLGAMALFVVAILFYVREKIIVPFHQLEEVPYELSKGNMTVSLKEEKSRYFGKFVWGLNMLREKVEERRENELEMHRDKKLLMLSLTHDIKTPLSVIKLNAQAIEKGLFTEKDRIKESAKQIDTKVNEIEQYVSQITEASKDDFLDLTVVDEDFYLSEVVRVIIEGYSSKLELRKTEFEVEEYRDCIVYGDKDRLIEVMQNIMDNAIKYGDGREIRLAFGREEDCALVSVISSGATLDKGEISKVFDSFFRGSNSTKQSGSGLGLYICRQLMSKMNGDIFVKEEEDYFSVTLVIRM